MVLFVYYVVGFFMECFNCLLLQDLFEIDEF